MHVTTSNLDNASFTYDGDGRRVIATEAGTTTIFIGNHFEWKNSTMTKYYYAGGQRVAVRNGDTSGTSQLSYLLTDHLGSTRLTYRADTAAQTSVSYTSWGVASGNFGTTTAYTYTGQYSHTATFGLMYYNARWYDPTLKRFAQADTIIPEHQDTQAYDRYAYVNNNPIKFNDPSGHFIDPFSLFVGAMIVGAVVGGAIDAYQQYQNTGTIDAGQVAYSALGGAVITGGVVIAGFAAATVVGGVAAAATGSGVLATAACSDGDCTNEARSLTQAATALGDPVDEINSLSQNTHQYWTNTAVYQGNTVYQRPDLINPGLIQGGLSNLQRMQLGRPPIGPDGHPLQLHHMLQTMDGPIAEVTQTFHQTYSSIIHINPSTISSGINRAAFSTWRAGYWIDRAKEFLE